MECKSRRSIGLHILSTLLQAYLLTGGLLIILAFLLYKFQWDEKKIAIGILIIYSISTLWGGFVIGKYMKRKKYIWGMIVGILYVGLLVCISFGVYRSIQDSGIFTTVFMCICSGALGGMIS